MSTNPFDEKLPPAPSGVSPDDRDDDGNLPPLGGTLSAEDQAEYDRLAAEEAAERDDERSPSRLDEQADGAPEGDEGSTVALPHQVDDFPVDAYGNVRAADAVSASAVYDTPWGRREMSHDEVAELAARKESDRVICTLVDGEAETSLQREKDDMAHITLSDPDLNDAKN